MRRVVSLSLPNWPTDRLHRQAGTPPEAEVSAPARPLLAAQRFGSRRLITSVDAEARKLDLTEGMAVAQAQAMVPELRIVEADPEGDAAALNRLAAWCLHRMTPLAAPDPPDGVWLDVTGCTHLFGGEAAMLRGLLDRLGEAGFAARAAMAETPGAAHALARWSEVSMTIAPAGGVRQLIEPLPVAALRLDDPVVQSLRRLGFDTIGQLMRTPRAPLARRFGGAALRRLDQALGHAPEPIEPMAVAGLPRARMGFPEPIATSEDFARATKLLVESLCGKLQRRGLGASRLDLVFQRVDGAAQAIRIGTAAPTREADHLVRLLLPQLENIDPGFGIESMMLTASLANSLDSKQMMTQFGQTAPNGDLSRLVDTLSSRLGSKRIFRTQPVQSDLPERSVCALPPLARAEGASWPDRLRRPTRLFDPPKPVDAVALLPDHPPARFTWKRRSRSIRRADGPERVFGEWWKVADELWTVRDYFQVEDEDGQRFWLFRRGDGVNPDTGDMQWFLHGIFA